MPLRHADICAALRGEVADGTYGVGMRFPSELDLQVRFGVGRHTAREALRTLTEEGYIGRKQRQGTFVVAAQPNSRFVQGLGTLDNLMDFGAESRLDIRSFGYVRLRDPTLCQWLRLPSDERWLRIAGVRVHRQSHQPLCWSEFFIPPRYPVARESLEGLDRPIHDFMARTHGFEIGHVEQEIGAAAIPARIAEPLQAAANSPALVIVRRYHRSTDVPADDLETLTQATLNLFPAGRYWVRTRIEREGSVAARPRKIAPPSNTVAGRGAEERGD